MKIVYRFFHRFQEFVQLVPPNFDSKHGSDPFKSTPRMKYSGKNSSVNTPLKICISHDLQKNIVFSRFYLFSCPSHISYFKRYACFPKYS